MDESQDWGIVNGSRDRFEEFMRIYRDDHLTPAQQSAMAGLVLASASERLDVDARANLEEFAGLLPRIAADNPWRPTTGAGSTVQSFRSETGCAPTRPDCRFRVNWAAAGVP
ncbi:MAG TPA: hypothetical protein VIJ51_12050 [Solirubrobacteraceae bacterium]